MDKCITKPPHDWLFVSIPDHPVSVNHIWKRTGARFYKVPEANRWSEVAKACTRMAAMKLYKQVDLSEWIGWPIEIQIDVCRPSWRGKSKATRNKFVRPDLGNFLKLAEDSVMEALCLDDSAVVELRMRKCETESAVRTDVRLRFVEM